MASSGVKGWVGKAEIPFPICPHEWLLGKDWERCIAERKVPGLGICTELDIGDQAEICLRGEWCISMFSAQLGDSVSGSQT